MLWQWFLTPFWQTVVQKPTLKHNDQECQSDEGEACARKISFFPPLTIQKFDKTEDFCAG